MLSKKLIALQIPTTQIIVRSASRNTELVGLPTVFVSIKTSAVNTPAKVCAINLDSGVKCFLSSIKPISPKTIAGAKTLNARK